MVLQWCSRSREYWEKRTQLSEALPYLTKSTSHCMRIIAEIENQACAGHIPWLSGPSTWLVVLATRYVRGHWTQTVQITWYPKPPSPHTHNGEINCCAGSEITEWHVFPSWSWGTQIPGLPTHVISIALTLKQGGLLHGRVWKHQDPPPVGLANQYIIEGTLGEVPKPTDYESYNSHRLFLSTWRWKARWDV
jgi:hypothetical protein